MFREPTLSEIGRKLTLATGAMLLPLLATGADVSALPAYVPAGQVQGEIRQFGSPLGGVLKLWEEAFAKRQPGVKFVDNLVTSDAAVGAVVVGAADIGASGREPLLSEYLAYYEVYKTNLVEIPVASGSYAIQGRSWALTIFVHKDNPISKLTMEQLDGIFGAERNGGYAGFKWRSEAARGPEKNIRTWDQLGLKGEWAKRPINTYGYAFSGMTNFFQQQVFRGGEKWNPNYKAYVETGTKMTDEEQLGTKRMLEDLEKDKYGIGWSGIPQAKKFAPSLKPLALAAKQGGPYVAPSKESVQDRSYPLARFIQFYIKILPDENLSPQVKEFLNFVLSREGQQIVVDHGIYEPLTAAVAAETRRKYQ